jgi:hypothetical protein
VVAAIKSERWPTSPWKTQPASIGDSTDGCQQRHGNRHMRAAQRHELVYAVVTPSMICKRLIEDRQIPGALIEICQIASMASLSSSSKGRVPSQDRPAALNNSLVCSTPWMRFFRRVICYTI